MPSGQICDIVSDNGKDSVKNCIVLTKTAWLFGKLMVLSSAKEVVVRKKIIKDSKLVLVSANTFRVGSFVFNEFTHDLYHLDLQSWNPSMFEHSSF